MKHLCNLGHHERIIRITKGLILMALSGFSTLPGWWDLLLIVGGLVALLTGIVGHCPGWHALGINTCKVEQGHSVSNPKEEIHEQGAETTHQS